jgi:hypothetical protein
MITVVSVRVLVHIACLVVRVGAGAFLNPHSLRPSVHPPLPHPKQSIPSILSRRRQGRTHVKEISLISTSS